MSCIDDILNHARTTSPDVAIETVMIGLHWTAVRSRYLGLAATQTGESCCYTEDINGAGQLHLQSAYALSNMLRSDVSPEASVGMAALNSFLEVDEQNAVELNARDVLVAKGRGKTAALVGHFHFSDAIRQSAKTTWILELEPREGDLPASAAPEYLPQADVIAITASTLLNHTFEDLAQYFRRDALVVMLGPSTPLSRILFDYGVDVLAGSRVTDVDSILTMVSQASPLHRPAGLRRITLAKDKTLSAEFS